MLRMSLHPIRTEASSQLVSTNSVVRRASDPHPVCWIPFDGGAGRQACRPQGEVCAESCMRGPFGRSRWKRRQHQPLMWTRRATVASMDAALMRSGPHGRTPLTDDVPQGKQDVDRTQGERRVWGGGRSARQGATVCGAGIPRQARPGRGRDKAQAEDVLREAPPHQGAGNRARSQLTPWSPPLELAWSTQWHSSCFRC